MFGMVPIHSLDGLRHAIVHQALCASMKIAFIATNFLDYSLEFACELGLSDDVLLLVDGRRLEKDAGQALIAQARARTRFVPFRQHSGPLWPKTTAAIAARLIAFRPDIVLAHEDWRPYCGPTLRLAARIAKLVLIVHDPAPHPGRDGENARRNAKQIETFRSLAGLILVHGEKCAGLLASVLKAARPITSIPHGPGLRPQHIEPPPDKNRLLMFGRMEAYKGLDVLLEACRILDARHVPYELTLAGTGPELTFLQGEFRSLKSCTVRNEFVAREEAIRLFHDCDFVLAPYTGASQSGVVAAAFANGRPVIASDIGGLPDVIQNGKNGYLVPPGNPNLLAAAISQAFEDRKNGQALWKAALFSSEHDFTWKIAAARLRDAAKYLTSRSKI
ncbi:MAG: glycosyltransferase family 4 protein [Proteobacteria bacterium]|nr:glycosyltransferase family 4 protein [Pseudomonadota bacterium]